MSYPGHYQDLDDGTRGIRAVPCADTWRFVQPHVLPGWVVFEVGCDLGWFGRRMADMGCLAVGFEQDGRGAQHAARYAGQRQNQVICNHKLTLDDLICYSHTVETIDCIMMLAVLHYLSAPMQDAYIGAASKIAHTVIVEAPEVTDDTLGHAPGEMPKILARYFKHVEVIGENVVAPTQVRRIYKASNDVIDKDQLAGTFFKGDVAQINRTKRCRLRYEGGAWRLWKRPSDEPGAKLGPEMTIARGVNCQNFLWFNVLHPVPEWWAHEAAVTWEALLADGSDRIANIAPQSLVLGTNGHMFPIDYHGKITSKEQKASIERVRRVFTGMTTDALMEAYRS